MKNLLAVSVVSALLFSAHATAGCPAERPGQPPALPDGSVAKQAEMLEAGKAVEQYVESVERYLECRGSGQHDVTNTHFPTPAEPVTSAYLLNWSGAVTAAYEQELAAFRQRKDLLAKN